MDKIKFIDKKVHSYYWDDDINCARTMLKTLSEYFKIELHDQVVNSAVGLHGAGKYGAQCGLVEGMLMFIAVASTELGKDESHIVNGCYDFAKDFEQKFKSLSCRDLRIGGFKKDDPPHLCEDLTKEAVRFAIDWFEDKNYDKISN